MYWRFITPDPMLNHSPKLRSQEREDDEGAFTVTALSHDDNGVGQPSTRLSPLMHEASKRMSPPPGYPDTSRECNAP